MCVCVCYILGSVCTTEIKVSNMPRYCDPGVSLFKGKLFEDIFSKIYIRKCVFCDPGSVILKDKLFKDTGICRDPGGVTFQK